MDRSQKAQFNEQLLALRKVENRVCGAVMGDRKLEGEAVFDPVLLQYQRDRLHPTPLIQGCWGDIPVDLHDSPSCLITGVVREARRISSLTMKSLRHIAGGFSGGGFGLRAL